LPGERAAGNHLSSMLVPSNRLESSRLPWEKNRLGFAR